MKCKLQIVSLASLLAVVACGGGSGSGGSSSGNQISQNETIQADGSNVDGAYASDIYPVNYNLQLKTIGQVAVQREGDNFTVAVQMNRAPAAMRIRQAIYYGRRCPNINDDLNHDAYIDITEARIAMGNITIPLDGDLNSQSAGMYQYPVTSTRNGSYFYKQSASFDRLFSDLKDRDDNTFDDIMKLSADDGLTLPGRVVLFQGMTPGLWVPDTVQGENGMTGREALPVGCAVLWKVRGVPEILNQ